MSINAPIRSARVGDAERYLGYTQGILDERLETLCPRVKRPSLEEMRDWMALHAGESGAIYIAENEELIVGNIDICRVERPELDHTIQFGMSVRNGYRNSGIGTRLLERGLDWFYANAKAERMQLEVSDNNVAALNLYRKHGFVVEGIKRRALKKDTQYIDLILMSIVK